MKKISAWILVSLLMFSPLTALAEEEPQAPASQEIVSEDKDSNDERSESSSKEKDEASEKDDDDAKDEAKESSTSDEINVNDDEILTGDLSPWGMYQSADDVVKSVMVLLLFASFLTWTVWAFKTVQVRIVRRRTKQTLSQLVDATSFAAAKNSKAAGASKALLQATELELQLSQDAGKTSPEGVKERVAARLERIHASTSLSISRGTSVLATIGAIAPFVGLFGTVWGIMGSFIGIAESQTTNLAVVAPGIAEALLATAMGLVAAIPAVIFYNHFAKSIAGYKSELSDTVASLLILVSRDLEEGDNSQGQE